jgi:hypothetical protein
MTRVSQYPISLLSEHPREQAYTSIPIIVATGEVSNWLFGVKLIWRNGVLADQHIHCLYGTGISVSMSTRISH